jgi:hypothetical protein
MQLRIALPLRRESHYFTLSVVVSDANEGPSSVSHHYYSRSPSINNIKSTRVLVVHHGRDRSIQTEEGARSSQVQQ